MAVALGRTRLALILALRLYGGLSTCNLNDCEDDHVVLLQTVLQAKAAAGHVDHAPPAAAKDKLQILGPIWIKYYKSLGDFGKTPTLKATVLQALDATCCLSPLLLVALGLRLLGDRKGTPDRFQGVPEKRHADHFDALTGIRAPLILLIFFCHAGVVQLNPVGSFIMLSGTVLSLSRITAEGEVKVPLNSASGVGKFILTRTLRVLPLSFACYCMPWETKNNIIWFWTEWAHNFLGLAKFLEQMLNLLSATGLGHFWFVQTIIVLYALYPLLEALLHHLRRRIWCWWMWILVGCFALKLCTAVCVYFAWRRGALHAGDWYIVENEHSRYQISLYSLPFLWVPDFLVGMVLPHLQPSVMQMAQSQFLVTCADVIAIGSLLTMFVMPSNPALIVMTDFHFQAPCSALLLWSLFPGDATSICRRILKNDVIVQLGAFSFAFYLCQLQVLLFVSHSYRCRPLIQSYSAAYGLRENLFHNSSTAFAFVASLLLASLTSWALHRVVEQPVSQLVRRCLE